MSKVLKEKTTKGLFWNFIDKFGQQIFNIVSGIILARILSPDDYGLTGSLAVFIALSNVLIDSGFGRALINKKGVTAQEYSTVFYFNVAVGVIIYLVLFVLAPYIAAFYKDERILDVTRIYFIVIIINSFSVIQNTLLAREFRFREATYYSLTAIMISAVAAIVMAVYGYGVWAIVAQAVLLSFIRTVLLWVFSSWRPIFYFKFSILKTFLSFSSKLLSAGMLNAFFNNIYTMIIGYFYNLHHLGIFTQANKYQEIPPNIIGNTFRTVAISVFAEVNDDEVRMRGALEKNMKFIAFSIFPLMLLLILIAQPLFLVLFKEKWLPSVPYFQILCIGGMFAPFISVINELFIAKGRSNIFLGIEFLRKILLILLIVILFSFGITGLSWSWSIYSFVTLLISVYFLKNTIKYSFGNFVKDVSPYLLTSLASGAIIYFVPTFLDNPYLIIRVSGGVFSIVYISLCSLFKLYTLNEVLKILSFKK